MNVVYTYIQKAFNIIKKLSLISVHFSFLNWVQSYLHNHLQYVKVLDWVSNSFKVCSGVPQGSYLVPLLILLFINDILNIFKFSNCLLFADDLKLFKSFLCVLDSFKLQMELYKFSS